MSIERPRFMLGMILVDIERLYAFLLSSEFAMILRQSDVCALSLLRFANSGELAIADLEAFLKEISESLKRLESQPAPGPEDHVMMIDHQRRILPFQLACQHASVELWNLKASIAESARLPEEKVIKKSFFRRR